MATESELSRDADAALAAVDARMIEAEKDARFAEAMRRMCGTHISYTRSLAYIPIEAIDKVHRDIYDRPCTASAKTEGKSRQPKADCEEPEGHAGWLNCPRHNPGIRSMLTAITESAKERKR